MIFRYEYTRTNKRNRYWRKNRGKNPGSNCIGVDLNRNWGYKWGGMGASTNPCRYTIRKKVIILKSFFEETIPDISFYFSDTYRGSKAFSEPETKAVRDFILRQRQKQDFKVFIKCCIYDIYFKIKICTL